MYFWVCFFFKFSLAHSDLCCSLISDWKLPPCLSGSPSLSSVWCWPIHALFPLSGLPATWHHVLIHSLFCCYPVTSLSRHFFPLSCPRCLTSNTHLSILPSTLVCMSIHSSPLEQFALLSQQALRQAHTDHQNDYHSCVLYMWLCGR